MPPNSTADRSVTSQNVAARRGVFASVICGGGAGFLPVAARRTATRPNATFAATAHRLTPSQSVASASRSATITVDRTDTWASSTHRRERSRTTATHAVAAHTDTGTSTSRTAGVAERLGEKVAASASVRSRFSASRYTTAHSSGCATNTTPAKAVRQAARTDEEPVIQPRCNPTATAPSTTEAATITVYGRSRNGIPNTGTAHSVATIGNRDRMPSEIPIRAPARLLSTAHRTGPSRSIPNTAYRSARSPDTSYPTCSPEIRCMRNATAADPNSGNVESGRRGTTVTVPARCGNGSSKPRAANPSAAEVSATNPSPATGAPLEVRALSRHHGATANRSVAAGR